MSWATYRLKPPDVGGQCADAPPPSRPKAWITCPAIRLPKRVLSPSGTRLLEPHSHAIAPLTTATTPASLRRASSDLSGAAVAALDAVSAFKDETPIEADNDPLIRSQAQYMALLEESLSAAEAAKLLHVDVSRVRSSYEPGAPPVTLPMGCTNYPMELVQPPRSWVERRYQRIFYWNDVTKGGHFADPCLSRAVRQSATE